MGTLSLTLTEPTVPGKAVRTLPTTVWYPATGPAGRPDQAGATPLRSSGPYPLVVFSQGFELSRAAYAGLLDAWSAAGYVVAAPAYPFNSPTSPGGARESDIVNHPADLRFVITSMLQEATAGSGTLSGLIEASQIAVIGHSDGGDVSLATASNSCCRDSRIKAAVILSGAELTSFGGTYYATPPVPMLVVQGTADAVNPSACSILLYDQAPQPKYYLSLTGQNHTSAYTQAGEPLDVVAKVTIDFLDTYLKGSKTAAGSMVTDGTVPGLAALTNAPTVTPAFAPLGGSCPQANSS
ncbi:MAG: alpha/beta hydrolase family protein [Acidimicrobiales bacterium]